MPETDSTERKMSRMKRISACETAHNFDRVSDCTVPPHPESDTTSDRGVWTSVSHAGPATFNLLAHMSPRWRREGRHHRGRMGIEAEAFFSQSCLGNLQMKTFKLETALQGNSYQIQSFRLWNNWCLCNTPHTLVKNIEPKIYTTGAVFSQVANDNAIIKIWENDL